MFRKFKLASGRIIKNYEQDQTILKKIFRYIDSKGTTTFNHLYNHFDKLSKIEVDSSVSRLRKENKIAIQNLNGGKTIIKPKLYNVLNR